MDAEVVTLYRPVGLTELKLIEASGYKQFPPRLPEQPIFYPVLSEDYAIAIAKNWNARNGDSGYVTCFDVRASYLRRYPMRVVGSTQHQEYWIPAEDLDDFNKNIVGNIKILHEFNS